MAEVRQFLVVVLTEAGYNVLTVATVPEAIQLAKHSKPDLLLIDVRMGNHNGIQVAVHERARGNTVPIIIMSGYEDPVLVKDAERLGAVFLLKPFVPDALLEHIERLLPPDR